MWEVIAKGSVFHNKITLEEQKSYRVVTIRNGVRQIIQCKDRGEALRVFKKEVQG